MIPTSPSTFAIYLIPLSLGLWAITALTRNLYRSFCGPLSDIPGPKWRKLTNLPHLYSMWMGREATDVAKLHQKYGDTVRLAPDLIAFLGEGDLWKDIYASKAKGVSKFRKDRLYYDVPINNIPDTTFDIMSDMLLSEPLHMLEKGEYAPLVSLVFWLLKYVTRLKTFRYYSRTYGPKLRGLIMKIPAIGRIAREHHHSVTDRVDERMAKEPEQPDIWSLVTANTSTASLISTQERYSIANELMMAGTETTATTLSGIMYNLLQNPQWMSTLSEHIRSQFTDIESLNMAALQGDKLLNAVIKEGLRMYPPIPVGFPREVPDEGCTIKGHFFPPGNRLAIYNYATYSSEKRFREPRVFHPERWMGDEKFKDDRVDSFEPFSVGLRACSAQNFAWHEMRLILATVLLNFDFELRPESTNWAEQKTYIVWEKVPLQVNVRKRV
ncbi:cytochrome P450 like protein [Zymoseptoria brevis]|uniref:Cytochrome P450 like protein n=1 Tax=Zymoseptoria brevis TaxID=1047168 RepID=A0A0F4GGV9_9PEZI|nr:cytochrome P450 like protein [Zymoseptoria brevis]